ncbi:DUF3710 domain-containing protein [Nesterenkonia massiliensis]|uniref:DUF3710 domain-containing protein n=1 Tax=Nesterenkonia massiliensis TaxID=1232429 RepID=UPI000416CDC0|nr:DUF3710 domain-containing protein [Nesterenkonia massiliensis]
MLFGRKKKNEPKKPATIREALDQESAPEVEIEEAELGDEQGVVAGEETEVQDSTGHQSTAAEPADQSGQADAEEALRGPRDADEVESKKGYLDFGALLVPAGKDQKVRLDIDQKTKRVVSLTIAVGEASIQLQAFSAPKSGGIWQDVRRQIEESVVKQHGRVKEIDGRFGKELHARVPTVLKDGRQGWRAARFIGFEGNRWFLRGVIGGRGAIDRQASAGVEKLFSEILVVRGDQPLPPRELLPLRPPAGAKRVVVPRQGQPATGQPGTGQPSTGQSPNRSNGVPNVQRPGSQPGA